MKLRGFLVCATAAATLAGAETLTVSPAGPLRTPAEARDAVRRMRAGGRREPVTIVLRGGTYFLSEPLLLTEEDSDTTWTAARDERPILSGGRRIEGWRKGEGRIWTAPAAGSFRQLFVAGRRALRARIPNAGFYRIDGPSSQDKPFQLKFRGSDIRKAWAGGPAEVVALLAWAELRMPIAAVDEETHVATLAGDPRASNRERDARYWIENLPEALDTAGEWYLDTAGGAVSYWPVPGDDLARDEVIAPALTTLVRLDGAQRVAFRGLDFRHADWSMGPRGFAERQAAMSAPAAFEAAGAREIAIENCVFTQLGGYAIWLGRGSQRNRIAGNHIFDVGAGGVKIGDTEQRPDPAGQSFDNVVTGNHIHDLGLVYPSAIGIWVGQSSRAVVTHNHVHDLYYTAVSVGWTWGYGPNQSKGNRIEYNHLHHIGRDMLSDMGAIYTLGVQPGTVIRNNLIHDVSAFTYGGWGIYPDEGSSQMLIENNIVYRTKSAGFHQHYGRDNVVRNNIFAYGREFQLMRTRAEPHLSFTFERNIVLFDQGRLLGGNWTGAGFRMDRNLYWDLRGGPIGLAGRAWEEWRSGGQDEHSSIADPLFVDAGNYDFRLRPDSPALKLGFRPIEMEEMGRAR